MLVPVTHKLVVFCGAQPKVKLVLLVTLIVGKADVVVTCTVLVLQQPFTLLHVNMVPVPGLVREPIDTLRPEVKDGAVLKVALG